MGVLSSIPTTGVRPHSRFPGSRPFSDTPEDRLVFCGRDDEIERLYLRVLSVSLLVMFAKSGLGKTSLLQAGLCPRLREKPFLPVMVRLNQDEPLVAAIARAIEQAAQGSELTCGNQSGAWELLAGMAVWREDLLLVPVLIFDQFEEVFTLRSREFREELAQELAALTSGVPPERLRDVDTAEFCESSSRLHSAAPEVKIVISLREEYLAQLEDFIQAIPNLFAERFRLEPLTRECARIATATPAGKDIRGDGWSSRFSFDEQALEEILSFLEGRSGVIELLQLQLICRHAERIASTKARSLIPGYAIVISSSELGGIEGLGAQLQSFYKQTIDKLSKRQRKRAQLLCEEGLLNQRGHRLSLDEGQIREKYRLTEESLKILAQERLLRREPRLDSVFYEISHDQLALRIFQDKPFRLPTKYILSAIGAAVVIGALIVGITQQNRLRVQATNARDRADRLLTFLLGEDFLGPIRDAGLGESLERVERRGERDLSTKDDGRTFTAALARRNHGQLNRSAGHLLESLTEFQKAEEGFRKLAENMPGDDKTGMDKAKIERARTLTLIGEDLQDLGRISDALRVNEQALEIREELRSRHPNDGEIGVESAESYNVTGFLLGRMGQLALAKSQADTAIQLALENMFQAAISIDDSANLVEEEERRRDFGRRAGLDPSTEALKVLRDAAFTRTGFDDAALGYDVALSIAEEVVSARPLSADARLQEARSAFWRAGYYRASKDYATAFSALQKVQETLNLLWKWDPYNLGWGHERSVLQDQVASTILLCRTEDCYTPGGDKPDVYKAEALNLESIKQLRHDVSKDDANVAWKADLAGGLVTRARIMDEENADVDECLAVVNEAISLYKKATVDGKNVALLFSQSEAFRLRAKIGNRQKNPADSVRDLDRGREILEVLAAENPDDLSLLYQANNVVIEELNRLSINDPRRYTLEQESKDLELEMAGLRWAFDNHRYQDPAWQAQHESAQTAVGEKSPRVARASYEAAIAILRAAADKDPGRAAIWEKLAREQHELGKVLEDLGLREESSNAMREALKSIRKIEELSPNDPEYLNAAFLIYFDIGNWFHNQDLAQALLWYQMAVAPITRASELSPMETVYRENEAIGYSAIALTAAELPRSGQDSVSTKVEEEALEDWVKAAWRAAVFTSRSPEKKTAYHRLYDARRELAKFLFFTKGGPKSRASAETAQVMSQAAREMELANEDDPEHYCKMGTVEYAIGRAWRQNQEPGWEEALRKSLVWIDRGLRMKPDNILCLEHARGYREFLGKQLLEDNRPNAGKQELAEASAANKRLESLGHQ